GRYTEASEYLLQAWDIAENASVKDKAKLSNEIAVNLFRRNHTVAAKNWFQQTLGFFKTDTLNCYPDYNVTTAMFGLALCYEVQQQIDSCSYWCTQAVLNDYYTQQLIDPWLYSKSNIYSNETQTQSAIALHHQLYRASGNADYLWRALWMTELSKGRRLMFEQQRSVRWQADTSLGRIHFSELRNDYLLLAQATLAQEKDIIKERISRREYQLSLKGNNFSQALSAPSFEQFKSRVNTKRQTSCLLSYYYQHERLYIIKADDKGLSQYIDTV